jgi:hypothetical protein
MNVRSILVAGVLFFVTTSFAQDPQKPQQFRTIEQPPILLLQAPQLDPEKRLAEIEKESKGIEKEMADLEKHIVSVQAHAASSPPSPALQAQIGQLNDVLRDLKKHKSALAEEKNGLDTRNVNKQKVQELESLSKKAVDALEEFQHEINNCRTLLANNPVKSTMAKEWERHGRSLTKRVAATDVYLDFVKSTSSECAEFGSHLKEELRKETEGLKVFTGQVRVLCAMNLEGRSSGLGGASIHKLPAPKTPTNRPIDLTK